MEQQEIDRIVAECKKITDEFRVKLKPAMDENGHHRTLKKVDDRGNQTDEYVQLLAATAEQVQKYIERIQQICNHDVIEAIKNFKFSETIIDCSYLYIKGELLIQGELSNSDFDVTIFSDTAYFSRVTFSQNANFRGAIFVGLTLFSLTIFSQKANFRNTTFSHYVSFIQATFSDYANFGGTTFYQRSDFKNAIFLGGVDFTKSSLSKQVGFHDVTFSGGVDFSDTVFLSLFTDFNAAKFMGNTSFRNVKFSGYVDFHSTLFSEGTFFHNIEFSNSVNFEDAVFLMDIELKSSKFLKMAYFKGVKFSKTVDFNNTKFKDTTNFSDCTFNDAPLFHKTTLHQDTSFEGARFVRCETEEDYRAYRTLKQHMSDVHAILEESRFFALEQRTRLKLDEELYKQGKKELLSNIIISKFYAGISDYGQDTLKPILLLISMWLLFGLLFSLPHMVEVNPEYSKIAWIAPFNDSNWFINIIKGLGYSFQSTFNPLSLFAKDIPFVAQNIIVLILAYIELLCAITFIALWLFAVRRRFQKGE